MLGCQEGKEKRKENFLVKTVASRYCHFTAVVFVWFSNLLSFVCIKLLSAVVCCDRGSQICLFATPDD